MLPTSFTLERSSGVNKMDAGMEDLYLMEIQHIVAQDTYQNGEGVAIQLLSHQGYPFKYATKFEVMRIVHF